MTKPTLAAGFAADFLNFAVSKGANRAALLAGAGLKKQRYCKKLSSSRQTAISIR
jgi:hypothetical protein